MRRLEAGIGIPADARPFVYGATLSGLSKPNGGLRPIAVGEMFSRVIGKAIAHHHKDIFTSFFLQHNQLGVSVPAGAETIVHATRCALQSPGSVSLQLDFKNAFNSLSRRLILQQLRLYFPHLIPYFLARYGQHTKLPLATAPPGFSIDSRTGVQQGDPMGPFFFALGLTAVTAPLFAEAASDSNHPLHRTSFLCLLDDITIAGQPENVASVANLLMEAAESTSSGLKLNSDKCVAWSFSISAADRASWSSSSLVSRFFSLAPSSDVCFPPCEKGIKLLGSYIGPSSFVKETLSSAVQTHTPVVADRLMLLDSLQMRILLLRHCADKKFSTLWRTVPPSLSHDAACLFDDLISGALRRCQDFGFIPGPDAARLQYDHWRSIIRLPLRLGGMALGSSSMVAPLAYVGSLADASRLILSSPMFSSIQPAFHEWLNPSVSSNSLPCEAREVLNSFHRDIQHHRGFPGQSSFANDVLSDSTLLPVVPSHLPTAQRKLQQRLCTLSFEMTDNALRGSVSRELRAQLLSQRCPVARGLMSAIPSCPELTAPNDVFGTFLFHYQCMHLIGDPQICCSCSSSSLRSSEAEPFRAEPAKHASSCCIGDAFTVRHHQGCMGVKAVLDWIPNVITHPRFSVNVPEENPDFDCYNLERGKHGFVEYSVVDHLQDAHVNISASTAGHAAEARDTTKRAKYGPLCLSSGRVLYTASQEASGRVSAGYSKLIELAVTRHNRADFDAIAPTRTWASDSLRAYLQQVIALNFWSGVVAAELGRVRVNESNEQSWVGSSLTRPELPFSCVNPRRWLPDCDSTAP